MSSQLILDHVILTVGQLPNAMRQLSQMGFAVQPGGVHAGGFTQNALVSFADGAYLELLATTSRSRHSWLMWLQRFGLLPLATSGDTPLGSRLKQNLALGRCVADFCLRSADLDADLARLESLGIQMQGPTAGSRRRPDGVEIAWRTAIPQSAGLPFLIQDITPREMRVPPVPEQGHPNQVTGIAGLTIGVRDLDNLTSQYGSLLALEPGPALSFPLVGVQGLEFSLDGVRIDLVRPEKEYHALRKAIGRRGVKPLVIWLRTPAAEPSGLLSLSYPGSKQLTLSRGNPFL